MTGLSLLSHRIRPMPAAYSAAPFTAAELDAHPDGARFWATILAMRDDHSGGRDRDWPSHRESGR